MQEQKKDSRKDDQRHEYIPGVQEKSTIGGTFNTGVTSNDPEEKEEIEKKGSLAVLKPKPESDDQSSQSERGE